MEVKLSSTCLTERALSGQKPRLFFLLNRPTGNFSGSRCHKCNQSTRQCSGQSLSKISICHLFCLNFRESYLQTFQSARGITWRWGPLPSFEKKKKKDKKPPNSWRHLLQQERSINHISSNIYLLLICQVQRLQLGALMGCINFQQVVEVGSENECAALH